MVGYLQPALLVMACSCVLDSSGLNYVEVYPPVNSNVSNTSSTSLYFALMMSFGGGFNSSGTVPGIRTALDRINNDQQMLPGYLLHYALLDSQCDHSVALSGFFQHIMLAPTKIFFVGAGCSVASEPVADVSHFFNLTQASCATGSPALADRARFRNYFQLLPTDLEMVPIFLGLCNQYGWTHLSIILQQENLFIETAELLNQLLEPEGIISHTRSFDSSKGVLSLGNKLFEDYATIYYLAMYSDNARAVICEAYKAGYHYPKYLFITYGWYADEWWMVGDVNCTGSEMEIVLEFCLEVTPYPETEYKTTVNDEGLSYATYFEEYTTIQESGNYIVNIEHDQCFDGIWSMAFALNRTITDLASNDTLNMLAAEAGGYKQGNFTFRLEHFTYNNSIVNEVIRDHMIKTNFNGVTGPVKFDKEGIRTVTRLFILQFRRAPLVLTQNSANSDALERVAFASLRKTNGSDFQFAYSSGESNTTTFPSGIPYDGIAEERTISVHLAVTIVFCILIFCGMVFIFGCLIFEVRFRKTKVVRLTSPNLNYIIIIGGTIMYVSAIFYVVPTTTMLLTTIFCNIGPRLFAIGYSLCFGTVLAKMWRVYYIFTDPTNIKKKTVEDWKLLIFVMLVTTVDIILLGVLSVYEGAREEAKLTVHVENPLDLEGVLGYRIEYYTYLCDSQARDIWLGIVLGYKAVLQIAAIFLAFGTRKVKVKGLDDSKCVAAAIYVTSIALVVIIISSMTINDYVNLFASLFATCILVITTIIMALVFIPIMVLLHKDPEGKTLFDRMYAGTGDPDNALKLQNNTAVSQHDMQFEIIADLEAELTKRGIPLPPRCAGTATRSRSHSLFPTSMLPVVNEEHEGSGK